MSRQLLIFHNEAGRPLASAICNYLDIDVGQLNRQTFADKEIFVQIGEDVRDKQTFIIAPTNPPAENIWETLLLIDALRQASAQSVTLVMPYTGYNRQDRKDRPRVARSALVLLKILRNSGIDRVLLLDLHSEATAGYFDDVIVDHLYGSAIIVPRLTELLDGEDFVIASPDKGGTARAQKYAEFLGESDHVIFSKDRDVERKVKNVKIIGEVKNKIVVLVDDMIDTGGTMVADAKAAMKAGASDVWAVATHALLSGDAMHAIDRSPISRIIVTDTIYSAAEQAAFFSRTTVEVLSAAPLLAKAIRRTIDGGSVSALIL